MMTARIGRGRTTGRRTDRAVTEISTTQKATRRTGGVRARVLNRCPATWSLDPDACAGRLGRCPALTAGRHRRADHPRRARPLHTRPLTALPDWLHLRSEIETCDLGVRRLAGRAGSGSRHRAGLAERAPGRDCPGTGRRASSRSADRFPIAPPSTCARRTRSRTILPWRGISTARARQEFPWRPVIGCAAPGSTGHAR